LNRRQNKILNNATILYDEQGTPTFVNKRETNYFIGVAVAFDSSIEQNIFDQCNELFGLSKSRPMKNDKITNSKAIQIGEQFSQMNLLIDFFYLDLSNEKLHSTAKLYGDFGNILREKHRGAKERNVAQILYGEVQCHTLFSIISKYIELYQTSTQFSIFIDNWEFPRCDINLALNMTSESLALKNNEINQDFFPGVQVFCDSLQLLDKDSKKKRFVDVLASIISRNFLDKNNPKYSDSILNTIFSEHNYNVSNRDITTITIDSLINIMDNISRNG
jgi:hypothetical protein